MLPANLRVIQSGNFVARLLQIPTTTTKHTPQHVPVLYGRGSIHGGGRLAILYLAWPKQSCAKTTNSVDLYALKTTKKHTDLYIW